MKRWKNAPRGEYVVQLDQWQSDYNIGKRKSASTNASAHGYLGDEDDVTISKDHFHLPIDNVKPIKDFRCKNVTSLGRLVHSQKGGSHMQGIVWLEIVT